MIRRVNILIDRLTLDGAEQVGKTAFQTALQPIIKAAVQAHTLDQAPQWPAGASPALQKIGTRIHSEMTGAIASQSSRKMEP